MTLEEGIQAAKTCYKYLKKGGYIRVAFPDGLFPDEDYINAVKPGGLANEMIAIPEDHKVLYTYKTFAEIFKQAGFSINLLEYHDESGKFHYEQWNPDEGLIVRSKRFDKSNKNGKLVYSSLILDGQK